MKNCHYKLITILFLGFQALVSFGQKDTSKVFKNTIRINLTNPMIIDSEFNVIGYERVLKDNQSFSVSMGRASFPQFIISSDSISSKNEKGIHFSVDYRWYLKKENKHIAPRGVYIGPYYAFNRFTRDLEWDLTSTTYNGKINADMSLTANLIGAQLGYQFVLWKRLSIDMILMGPGIWNFNLKTKFGTSLSQQDEEMLLQKLNELLQSRYPGSDLVINTGEFEASRNTSTSTMGFRYIINVGFRF